MKSYVFPDPMLRGLASRFVWLAIDTEREENAPLVTRLGVRALPTLYVIDPATERPVLAWPGSLTAPELADLLGDAELAARHGDAGGKAATVHAWLQCPSIRSFLSNVSAAGTLVSC